MAKQTGKIQIEGTIDGLIFYKMDENYYVRKKSSLTAKMFWKNEAFERSRKSSSRFAEGNKLASRLYRRILKGKKNYELFCFLKKRAILLLKEGMSLVKTEEVLLDYLSSFGLVKHKTVVAENNHKAKGKLKSCSCLVGTDSSFLNDCSLPADNMVTVQPITTAPASWLNGNDLIKKS